MISGPVLLPKSFSSQIKGRIILRKCMKSITWLRVGGEAEIFFQPIDVNDLSKFLSLLPKSVNITPIGVCSNVLVRDGGIPGVSIKLGRGFSDIKINDNYVTVGGAVLDSRIAEVSADMGVNLSFLRTIPGTIGGAVKMNAGCYGTCLRDVFESCEIVTRAGDRQKLTIKDLNFSYRGSSLNDDSIITQVTLRGEKEDPSVIKRLMRENQEKRSTSQPIKTKTGGSTFKNPNTVHKKSRVLMSAWELIDQVNLRGKKWGGAQVSKLHSNFLINLGSATAEDFECLGELIQERVYSETGVQLEWEIKKVGIRKECARTKSIMDSINE